MKGEPDTLQELVQAEERIRSVVDHIVEGIISTDESGNIDSFNPAAEKLFGYTQNDIIGKNIKLLIPEPYHRQYDDSICKHLSTGKVEVLDNGHELVGKRKDGSTFVMDLAVSTFYKGERRYFTSIVNDITERTKPRHELHQQPDDVADASRQTHDFLAMLAHELRNPLAPMRNALHLMQMPQADAQTIEKARAIMERQLAHMVRLVDDLLDVSRIISGKIGLHKEVLDFAVAVARAVETAQPVVDTRNHQLNISMPDRPIWVEADLVRLAQVISNLLTNAANYSDRAGRIDLAVGSEDGEAVMRIRDTGMGIPADLLPRIFNLFVQEDRSLARSQGGLGIGLTLVKTLVEMHGGSVTAASAGPEQGSEFVVRLPLYKPERQSAPGGDAGSTATHVLHKRVLVVDDNIDAAESTAMVLQVAGYEVRCVHDGPSVLQAAKDYRPQVVILDIGLPGISGYELARKLRQEPEFLHTPLIALTGYGQEEDRRRSLQAGFDHHLTKPADPQTLRALIAQPDT